MDKLFNKESDEICPKDNKTLSSVDQTRIQSITYPVHRSREHKKLCFRNYVFGLFSSRCTEFELQMFFFIKIIFHIQKSKNFMAKT